jgi:pimeloyl-ACP methyl ester carboxylesterase
MPTETPTIVFVHGAWADASGFGGSIRALSDRGLAAIGFANPLRHLTGDAAYLATPLGTISGLIVLVGHSYGGAVVQRRDREPAGAGAGFRRRVDARRRGEHPAAL